MLNYQRVYRYIYIQTHIYLIISHEESPLYWYISLYILHEKYLSPIPTHPMTAEGLLRILWLGNVRSGTDDVDLVWINLIFYLGTSNATDFHTGTEHQSVYHLAIPIYIYIIVIPNKMEKVIHHQITRDLLIYLFGDEHTCFPTWPCEVSITIHIGDMVVKRNIWLIELKPPIYLSSNRPKSIICPDSSPFTHHFPWVFFNFPSIPSIFPPFSHPFSLHFLNRVPVPGDDARAADPRRPGLRARLQQRPAAGGAGELPSEQRLGRMGIRRDDGILQLRHGSN